MIGSKVTSLVKLFYEVNNSDHYNTCMLVNAIERVMEGQDMEADKSNEEHKSWEVRLTDETYMYCTCTTPTHTKQRYSIALTFCGE